MGSSQNYSCCHMSKRLMIIFLLFLLLSSSTQVRFMAEGRAISKQIDDAQKGNEEEKVMVMRSQIGSTPPKCDQRMCYSCGHCEAIQVPVTTQAQNRRKTHISAATLAIEYSRGDDISNYKPMSWKCKCGSLIFSP